MISLRIRGLAHDYDGREVFDPIDLDFDGECLAILGPNGSGKSTLMRILAGLLTPTGGSAWFCVRQIPAAPGSLRELVGLSAPEIQLYEELTLRENLSFLARCRGVPTQRVERALDDVGLVDRARDLVGEFSSGMRRRASLAAAILHEPPVLLLDEPLSNLDEDGARMVRGLIERQRERGMAVIAASDPAEAAACDARLMLGGPR